jgi:putative surface-exposed virulence protein
MQKKKLLLLSAIVLLMGTNSYGRLYPKDGEVITQENIEKHLGEKPDKNGVATIVSIAKNVGASVDEKVNLELVNSEDGVLKKVINIASGSSDIATTNNGIIKATNNGGKGVEIVSIQSGKFVNNGTIGINGTGGKGINITGANVKTENNGTIEVNGVASGVVVSNDSAYFVNNETGKIIATGENSKGIEITKGTAENKGIIEAKDGAIGVYVNGGNLTNSGKIIASGVNTDGVRIEKGNFTTDENSVIEVNGSDKLTSGKSEASGVKVNGTSNFVNNGIIKVSGTTDGAYSGYQSKGININSATATAENKGTIIVERNGIGVGTKGTFTNNGGIKVSGSGIGINVIDSGNAINNEIIEADGKSYGIQVSAKGIATNKGTIIVKNGSTGITTSKVDGNTTSYTDIINEGVIEVSGDNSTGMQANDNRKVVNNGDILVNAGKFTSVMKAYGKNALAENNKNLTIIGDGINTSNGMIAQNGGKVVNGKDGVVKASGKTTSAMSTATTTTKDKEGNIISVIASSGENKGNIILENGAIGIKIDNTIEGKEQGIYSVGTSSGTIKGDGKGVTLNSGIFINSGTIDTTGNAIESYSGSNNTVYLKNGTKINGKIVGNTGIDVLALEGNKDGKNGKYSNLNVENYEALVVRDGDVTVNNSNISLNYNNGIGDYLKEAKEKLNNEVGEATSGNLTMNDSKLVINFGDKLKTGEALENPIIDVGENGTLTFDGKTSFIFNSKDRDEYNVNEILGVDNIKFEEGMKLDSTIIWDYTFDENGNLIAKKDKYNNIITNSYISDFTSALDKARPSFGSPEADPNNKFFENVIVELESLKNAEEFTKGLAQVSGGIHGYTVDIAAINSRTLVNTMKNKALTRDYLTARPLNSWYQDVIYLDNNQRLGGLMSGSYQENGILGISEKQSVKNGRLGFVYGGSKGKAKFDGGDSGEIATDNIYVGLYYNHNLSEKLALNTNFSFVYGHNNINRRVNIGNFNEKLKSHYPTYAMGVGTSAIYTIKDDAKNKASFYAGIDVNRIMQGNINEKEEERIHSTNQDNINLMVKNQNANEFSYYSITPHAGFMFQNTGYIFDRKYLVGADLAWETELGNIKDGKRLNMQGITDQYKVGTMERENVFSTSIFGQLDITESLALNGRYTSSISDEYDADMLTMGLTYKMDTMADTPIFGPLLSGIENTRLSSDRWSGTFALMMESEDDSDRVYYSQIDNSLSSGDYATSMKMKPKFTLSLNDKKTKWSYYFEGYYMANDFLKDTKAGEAEQKATRLHGEARWSDSYSKGRYGFNIGYRNETSDKPALSYTKGPARVERGVHQLRLTPNFSYNLGSGFRLDMKTTGIFEYNYTGLLEGQMDFLMENEHNLVYTGFMPRWQLRMGYYREDRWMDHDGIKYSSYNANSGEYVFAKGAGRYQMNQLRPSATYYFGNGDSITFALRVPLGNGAWYNSLDNNKKDSESYETRYTVKYNHVVVPGFNIFGELTFLDLKTKVTKENDRKVTRAYSFRPTVGFSYNF